MSLLSLIMFPCVIIALDMASAHADTCGDEIAQLEAWADQLSGQPVPTAHLPQSIDAQLHHQPTTESVRRAEENAQLRIAPILAVAKMLNTAGKSSECLQSVAEAKRLLGIY